LIYKLLFDLVGLHALLFRFFCFALLAFNIYLLYCVARRLTGSWQAAMFAALLGSFHSRMESLYTSVGNLFDIGCATFFLCALLYYIRWRENGRNAGLLENGALIFIYLCALDFKEMAVALPVVLVCYELVYHGTPGFQRSELRRWLTICILSLVTAAFLLPGFLGASTLAQAYRPQYSLHRFLDNWETYLGFLFYVLHPFSLAAMLTLLGLLLVVALVLKSRPLIFSWCFILIAPLPVSFIDTRGLNVWYIPFVGWVIYAATLLWLLLNKLMPASAKRGHAAVALFLILAALLAVAHTRQREYTFTSQGRENQRVSRFQSQFVALCPKLPAGSNTLLVDDPFGVDEWTPVTLLRLYFRDPNLDIIRMKLPQTSAVFDFYLTFDFVLDYHGDRLALLNSHPLTPTEVRSLLQNKR
jgi:hypothetical protein